MSIKILDVTDLSLQFGLNTGFKEAVRGISFSLTKGETLGIVGESGSGKSLTALSILKLLPAEAVISGTINYHSKEATYSILSLSDAELTRIRGSRIAMIFQEPGTSLNPVYTCGEQVSEVLRLHKKLNSKAAKEAVLALFEKVKLQEPHRVYDSFPHQLSGGQKQRIMIAMALSGNPELLIADEPTSSLDVTVQQSILNLLNELKTEWGGSMIFISHDLNVVAAMAKRVLVMQNGEVVEQGLVSDIFRNPQHAYTRKLISDSKLGEQAGSESVSQPIRPVLKASKVSTWFPTASNFFGKPTEFVKAVNEVDLELFPGETLGLVGESGSGKTTLGRSILFLEKPTKGSVLYKKRELAVLEENEWKPLRKDLQIIFQDPYSSLNPKQKIGDAIVEPMTVHGIGKNKKVRLEKALDLLKRVGLEPEHLNRYPDEFSGGQRQRICIARALVLQPKIIVCDECVSALDVSTQRQILDLLIELQKEKGLTYLFISHNLSVIRYISSRVAIMKEGRIVETGLTEQIWNQPQHDYTRSLLAAITVNY